MLVRPFTDEMILLVLEASAGMCEKAHVVFSRDGKKRRPYLGFRNGALQNTVHGMLKKNANIRVKLKF